MYNGEHKDKSAASWASQQGYTLTFTHEITQHSVEFPGNVTKFQDSHDSQQKLEYVYGQVDPLTRTQNTTRKVSFTLSLANASIEEARYNEQNINLLICMSYPKRDRDNVASGVPLIRVRGLNFIKNSVNPKGIAMYVGAMTYSLNIEAGFITSKGTGIMGEDEIYPAQIDITIEGEVRIDKYILDDGQPIPSTYPAYR